VDLSSSDLAIFECLILLPSSHCSINQVVLIRLYLKLYLVLNRVQEMVVLSGAHTIGGKGFGSPIVFDNTYFKVLLEKPQTSSSKCMSLSIVSILFPSPLDFQDDLSIVSS
jgi:hypothetical protein